MVRAHRTSVSSLTRGVRNEAVGIATVRSGCVASVAQLDRPRKVFRQRGVWRSGRTATLDLISFPGGLPMSTQPVEDLTHARDAFTTWRAGRPGCSEDRVFSAGRRVRGLSPARRFLGQGLGDESTDVPKGNPSTRPTLSDYARSASSSSFPIKSGRSALIQARRASSRCRSRSAASKAKCARWR